VEILVRLLRWSEVPRNVIDDRIREVRADSQGSDRKQTLPRRSLAEFKALSDLKVEAVQVTATSAGRSPKELDLRQRTGALVVAVRRGEKLLEQPDPSAPLLEGDVVYLVGTSEAVRAAMAMLA
jgi:K+/H+ antiporter YhaU regulatory subunit KhtT